MKLAALTTAFIVFSSAAWAECANVGRLICGPGASASVSGEATLVRGKERERVSGVSSIAPGQRVIVAAKHASLALGEACKVNVPAFSSVTLSANEGSICASGLRDQKLNPNLSTSAVTSGLDAFVAQSEVLLSGSS